MSHRPPSGIRTRPATPADEDFVRGLAPRLVIGIAPWRDPERMRATMGRFLIESLQAPPEKGMMVIAEQSDGTRLGAASVARHVNFTGEPQAYLGELAVAEEAEGRGIGRLLVEAVERWARDQGYGLMVLETGAANTRARGFYAGLGYREESVRLVKELA